MDVRCEKCHTEYELDEARLKPGGVTVKCTNCGHMFKIRKRTITNVGTPPIVRETGAVRGLPSSRLPPLQPGPPIGPPAVLGAAAPAGMVRPDSIFDEDARQLGPDEAPTTVDRQWLLRLENGEQKSCRELATLQQWIIAGVVTRESLISRTGKTWKRLGDIADLGQYFTIADEARATRDRSRPVSRPGGLQTTIPGYSAAQAAGGTILPDDDDDGPEGRTIRTDAHRGGHRAGRGGGTPPPPVPPRGAARTPPVGVPGGPNTNAAIAPTEPVPVIGPPPLPARRSSTTPPPPPPKRLGGQPTPQPPAIPPQGNRATAMWATDGVSPTQPADQPASRPFVGKLAAIPDEPAFAGRVRMAPGDEATFETGKVRAVDDDDDFLPVRRGSRVGMLVLAMALVVMAAAAAVVYVFVIRDGNSPVAQPPVKDAPVVVVATPDAAPIEAAVPDAAVIAPMSPLEIARQDLAADVEPRLRTAAQALDGKTDAPSQALRAHLIAQLAQGLQDRASVIADRTVAETLRREAKQLVLDAATAAQRALMAAGDDAGANVAMAEVLRLQGKPARDIKRYLDTARARADKNWARDLALADAMLAVRDGKLDDARAAFSAIDQGDGKLETSGDVRARFHLALVLAAQNKPAEARPLVDAVLAAQPEHAGAKALAGRLETAVVKTDPLPPEDGKDVPRDPGTLRPSPVAPGSGTAPAPGPAAGGDSYDRLLARANALAETSCSKAMELYARALEQKPNGVEALTGMGYCHIDAKEFASAFSKFRAALAVSPKYEAALRGVAEGYQQQGLKEKAIEAYRVYLDAYPGSAAARKQLERLGGDAAPPPAGGGSGSAAAPPPSAPPPASAPTPAPPPTPAPASPEAPGAGSGSG